MEGENLSDVLLRHYPVENIVKLDTVMDRVPRRVGAQAPPETWKNRAGSTDLLRARGLWRRKDRESMRPETVLILRKGLGMLYSRRMKLALDHLLDRLEERFDPDWFFWCRELNDHTEYVLCLETVVDALDDSDSKVPALLLDRIHELARIMRMSVWIASRRRKPERTYDPIS
ncbi:hypothetical protein C5D07_11755 [Rathayibacter tritici]|nr:hypothetical protein C5C06_10910 [Rathayibacter tritici]PPI12742.1 hypothetical protein C5D07_11755 [Rathayibacter tritici]